MSEIVFQDKDIGKIHEIIDYYIGSKTSGALSMMLNDEVSFESRILYQDIFDKQKDFPPANEIVLCSTFLKGEGDVEFKILYTLTEKNAKSLAAKLLMMENIEEINELSSSSIQEVANILTGSFFNAVTENTDFKIDLSTPDFILGSMDEAMKKIKEEMGVMNNLIVSDVLLKATKSEINLRMIIVQQPKDAQTILEQYKFLDKKINS